MPQPQFEQAIAVGRGIQQGSQGIAKPGGGGRGLAHFGGESANGGEGFVERFHLLG